MRRSRNYYRKLKELKFIQEVIGALEKLRDGCRISQQESPEMAEFWKGKEADIELSIQGLQPQLSRYEERFLRAQFRGRNTAKKRGLL